MIDLIARYLQGSAEAAKSHRDTSLILRDDGLQTTDEEQDRRDWDDGCRDEHE